MAIAQSKIGRVQGAGIFTTTSASSTYASVAISTMKPTDITPLVGDSVLFPNGDIRKIESFISQTIVACSKTVTANITGPQGVKGDVGDEGPQGVSVISATVEEV